MKSQVLKLLLLSILIFSAPAQADEPYISFKLECPVNTPGAINVIDELEENVTLCPESVLSTEHIERAVVKDHHNPQNFPKWMQTKELLENSIPTSEIGIVLNEKGKEILLKISSENIGKKMAIFIDNKFIMAPVLRDRIEEGFLAINGNISPQYARSVAEKINRSN